MTKKKANSKNRKIVPDTELLDSDQEQKTVQKTNTKSYMLSYEVQRQRVLQFLGGNEMPKSFNHRNEQIKEIRKYIESCTSNKNKNKYRILMVTGSPGAGKTLCVSHVLSKLQKQGGYKVIKLNANITKTVRDVQQIICSQILQMKYGNQMSTLQIMRHLQNQKIKSKFILYIEQIEIILQQKTNIFTEDFFCLFSNPKLNLMMLGISNTIDALIKYSKSISLNLKEIKNIVFQPYSLTNLADIMKEKLNHIGKSYNLNIAINDKVLNFIAGRIQNMKKGDIRIVLEFLKSVVEKVLPKNADEDCSVNQEGYIISITLAQDVFAKMRSAKHQIISTLPHTQQIVLIAVYLHFKQNDCLYMNMRDVQKKTKWICESLGLQYILKLVNDGCQALEINCLISRQKKANQQRVFLKVSMSQVEISMSDHALFKKFFVDID